MQQLSIAPAHPPSVAPQHPVPEFLEFAPLPPTSLRAVPPDDSC